MAIFTILLTFSAVSAFVLRSRANSLDSVQSKQSWQCAVQRKRFLLLSLLINLPNSSCTESEIDDSFLISALLVSTLACDCSKSNRFSVEPSEFSIDVLIYLFLLLTDVAFCCRKYFFSVSLVLQRQVILFEALFLYLIALKKLLKVRNLTISLFQSICQVSNVFVLAISNFPQF